jgi:phosphate transport system substrate-binding protein
MAQGEYRLRWAAKVRAAATFCLAGAAAGTALYFGNLSYVKAGDDAARAVNLVACAPGSLQVVGSSAFGPLAQVAANAYMADCPHVNISITSNDSAYGVSQVEAAQSEPSRAGSTIAMYDGLATAGFTARLRPYPVAALIFSIVAHNGTFAGSNVTTDQLREIFAGPDEQRYIAIGRKAGSGGRYTLFVKVLNENPATPVAASCPAQTEQQVSISCTVGSTAAALNFVNGTPHSVSYAEVYGAALASNPQVSVISINNAQPTIANVLSGKYGYWTVEHLYTGMQPTALATDFIKFLPQYIESSKPVGLIACSAATTSLESDC